MDGTAIFDIKHEADILTLIKSYKPRRCFSVAVLAQTHSTFVKL